MCLQRTIEGAAKDCGPRTRNPQEVKWGCGGWTVGCEDI